MSSFYAPEILQAAFDAALDAITSARQQAFVREYLVDFNGKQAAIRAGYSKKTAEVQASQTLRILKVREAIEAGQRLLMWRVMDADELRARISLRSRSSLHNVLSLPATPSTEDLPLPVKNKNKKKKGDDQVDEQAGQAEQESPGDGQQFVSTMAVLHARSHWQLDLVKAQQTGGIHQIKKLKQGKYGLEIEMHDPHPAQELLAKILKLSGDGGILKYIDLGKLSTEQVQRIADGEDPLAVILSTPTQSASGA